VAVWKEALREIIVFVIIKSPNCTAPLVRGLKTKNLT
jgi:hypothetical protein